MIRKDGYYISDGLNMEDWHAGHKFEQTTYKILVFFENNLLLRLVSSKKGSNIEELISKSVPTDNYKHTSNILEITINPDDPFSKTRKLSIVSSDIILDENRLEYKFISNLKKD